MTNKWGKMLQHFCVDLKDNQGHFVPMQHPIILYLLATITILKFTFLINT